MLDHKCYLARLDKEETVDLLRGTLAEMNMDGLQCVVQGLLGLMFRSGVTGKTVNHILETEVSHPLTQTVMHIHLHLVHHLTQEAQGDADGAAPRLSN